MKNKKQQAPVRLFKIGSHVEVERTGYRGKVIDLGYDRYNRFTYHVDFSKTMPTPYGPRTRWFTENQLKEGKYLSNWEIWKRAIARQVNAIFGTKFNWK